ncbi:MAG: VanZ family protein [Calditrichaeota bacterium]|nr:VanZ family protein [Calditrichota bacterium]RQV98906.1 MAG: VanZ family protein [Calditrichota bacterium]
MRYFIRFHLPVLIFVVGIFILSSIQDISPPDLGFKPQDKFYHLVFYFVFGFFIVRSFRHMAGLPKIRQNAVLFSIVFGSLYALSDEIHQYFVPGRLMSYGDFVADTMGILVGVLAFKYYAQISGFIKGNFRFGKSNL